MMCGVDTSPHSFPHSVRSMSHVLSPRCYSFFNLPSFHPSFSYFCPSRTFSRYVLDCEFNMDHFPSTEVENRTVAFVRQLRAARPTTPIIITEGHPATQRWFFPAIGVTQNSTRAG